MPIRIGPLSAPSLFRTSDILTVKLARLNLYMEPIRKERVPIVWRPFQRFCETSTKWWRSSWAIWRTSAPTMTCTHSSASKRISWYTHVEYWQLLHECSFARYGEITECDKLTDKPFGFVHMSDFQVGSTIKVLPQPWTTLNNFEQLWTTLNNLEQPWTTLNNLEQL